MTVSRLAALRSVLETLGVDGFVVPRADEHLGEYVPASAERLAWLTGFTGSAGLAIVLKHEAAAFTDGRYVLQMAAETDGAAFERLHITEQPPPEWAAKRAKRLGYDPWLLSEDAVARYTDAGLDMAPLSPNPIDSVWEGRPPPPVTPAIPQPLEFAGRSAADKIAQLAETLRKAGEDACVLTDPASIGWLLNVRGADIPFVPVSLAFAILHADSRVDLFIDPAKLSNSTREWLGDAVECHQPGALVAALHGLSGRLVRVDQSGAPVAVSQALRVAGATVVAASDPCLLPKAAKNAVEQEGARAAHRRDAVAMCRFLHWLDQARGETEMSAAAKLLSFRSEAGGFKGESFPAITGAGEHGAVIHYRASPQTNRAIGRDEVYLIDSGGQFEDGTTDITRTIWTGPADPPAELRERFTRVLKGNIALATAIFPRGVAGPHLDALARRALWEVGLDYDHGTGHGVGSYLSVHEGPVSISRAGRSIPIEAGMILSNEPGFYAPGQYGIRLETLLLVQPAELAGATRAFLRFEVLSFAPFDRRLIDASLLTEAELNWLNDYHVRVAAMVTGQAGREVDDWLAESCAPISMVPQVHQSIASVR